MNPSRLNESNPLEGGGRGGSIWGGGRGEGGRKETIAKRQKAAWLQLSHCGWNVRWIGGWDSSGIGLEPIRKCFGLELEIPHQRSIGNLLDWIHFWIQLDWIQRDLTGFGWIGFQVQI